MSRSGAVSARRVLVLQHERVEGPGRIAAELESAGVPLESRMILRDRDESALPPIDALAGLVVMGGSMGALDVDRFPGLALEARLIRAAVEASVPVVGVCLGHQLVATALGARLHAGAADEIGVGEVETLVEDPVLGRPGDRPPVLHWHRDVVEAPSGATVLARTPSTPVQAFRLGDAVLATQFHLEVDAPLLDDWLADASMLADLPDDAATLRRDFARVADDVARMSHAAFAPFAQACAARL